MLALIEALKTISIFFDKFFLLTYQRDTCVPAKFLTGGKIFGKIFGKYLIIRQVLQTCGISKNYLRPLWLGSQRVKRLQNSESQSTITLVNSCSSTFLSFYTELQRIEAVDQKCSVKTCFWKFHKIHRKAPVLDSLFLIKTLLKKRLWHRCIPVNFAKFLRTTSFQNTSGRLLLRKQGGSAV